MSATVALSLAPSASSHLLAYVLTHAVEWDVHATAVAAAHPDDVTRLPTQLCWAVSPPTVVAARQRGDHAAPAQR